MKEAVASRLVDLVERLIGAPMPVRLRAWDASEAGPAGGPVVVVRHRRALRRLLWNPGELGLARAFVTGELDVEGDLAEGLHRFWSIAREQRTDGGSLSLSERLDAVRLAVSLGAVGPRPPAPVSEARLSGRLHSRVRDRAAIAHHYDLSNDFYQLLLDPRLAYSCAYWTQDPADYPEYGLADAQRDKLDLICRKLNLRPGMRLLDVGCGWAALLIHAATHYGVTATGVTLSARQRDFGVARVAELGLSGQVEIRVQDYREITDPPYDAVASIEMGEHVGEDNYPTYAGVLYRLLRPNGRLLLQQMSRGAAGSDSAPGGGAFIERYVAPDMFMRPLGATLAMLEQAGHEVVDVHTLREHYVWTVLPWLETLRERREEAVALVGEEQYRVWLLYLAGAALAFDENRMSVHQMLAVRPDDHGRNGLPRARPHLLGGDPGEEPAVPLPHGIGPSARRGAPDGV
ncbi:SAM-dependent methyltransferase [Pseudonocardia spinosispora]|uniref:SAM-dependent methyltransferase n=1 Tax=Pseudonocardia spinosispora TaxID=103441 RepID=UPI0004235D4B|nr:cyclopropane-fatty-acyl-phospholipid synthase family protein [Pseudonocardia spinosispora]